MKAKMSYQNKKIAIITVIVLILIAGISIGAYSYFKGNSDAEATTSENTTINNETMSEQNSVSEENNQTSEETNTTENGSDANSSSDETNSESNNNENTSNNGSNAGTNSSSSSNNNSSNNGSSNDSNNNASNNGANSNGNTADSNDNNGAELPNEEYTQTDYIETGREILVSESLKVGWINAALLRDNVSTKIDVEKPSLELNKTAEINSINPEDNGVQTGSQITYNITVTNTSETVDANNVTVKDAIPEGTSFVEGSIAINGAINSELTDADLANGIDVNVPAGESVTVSFTVTVTAESGEIRNAAVVDGKDTPETLNPVIEASKVATSEDEVVKNDSTITYTITVTNKSNVNAITSVKDTVPEGTTLKEVKTEGSSVNEREIVWNNVTLEAGETKTFTFDVTVDEFDGESKIIRNVAVVGNDETPETETEVHYPVISSVKTADKGSVKVGETLTYTITLTNSGIVDGNVKVVDSSPIGTTFDAESGVTVSNQEGEKYSEEELNNGINVTVPASGTVTVTFTVTVNEGVEGSIINKATIDDGTPTDEENPSVETPVIVTEKTAEVNGEVASTVEKDDVITYTIKITNTGSVAGKAIVKDTVPAGTSYVEDSLKIGEEVQNKDAVAKFFGEGLEVEVAQGETVVSFQVTVDDAENVLENGDTISNTAYVNDEPTNETETTYQEPVFESKKETNKDSVSVGEELEYTITVKNTGSAAGTAIVSDNAPEGTHFAPESIVTVSNADRTYATSELIQGIPVELNAGETATVTFTVVVNESAEGAIINKATVNGDETGEEENPETQTPIISATKTATANGVTSTSETVVKQGDTITYTIIVTNTGDVAGKATVADEIPEGTTFVVGSIAVDGVANSELTADDLAKGIQVDIEANGTTTVSFDVTVGDLDNGATIRNVATVNGKDTPETDTEYQEPVISQNKTADKTAVVEGETITYTITVTNNGSAEGTVIVRDEIPTNTTFVANSIKVNDGATSFKEEDLASGIEVSVPAKSGETAGTTTVTFQVTVNEKATGSISNTAYVKDDEGDKEEPTNPVVTPIITAVKTATIGETTAETVKVGDIITYTITLTNTGSQTGTVKVTDSIPTGTTFVNGSIKVNGETRADLGAGNLVEGISVPVTTAKQATVSFQVEVQNINDKDQIKNTAYINDEPTNETVTEYQEPIISQSKSADKTIVVAGETITYTITATNTGSLAGTAIIRDEIPTNTTFVANSIKVNDGATSFKEEDLASGIEVSVPAKSGETAGTTTVTFQVTVYRGVTGSISNTAYVNDNQTGTVETPIITANKQASETRVEVGDTIKYTITLTNSSNVEGTFIVKDSIPANTTFTNESIAINNVIDTSKTLSDLTKNGISVTVPAKGKATLSFEVTVNEGTIAGTTIKNTATINGVPTNETTTTVVEPTLEISKTAETILDTDGNVEIPGQNKNEAEIGDTIVYTITVKNTSDVEADVNVTDTLPSAVTFERFTNNSAKATYSNGVVTYNGTLAGGQTLTIQFRATVNELASTMTGKEITNTAYVNEKPTSASTKVVKKVTLTTTAQTMNSLDLVLVLDVSTSMSNSGEIANLKTAAKNLANRVFSSETNSTITVITYAGTVRSTNTYDYDDRNNIITDIDRLGTHSGTNIYSALEKANSVVNGLLGNENAENRKRVVVFMTDGAPTFYTGGDNRNLAGLITAPSNSSNDWYYANNLRPQIIAQAESLKQKDVEVFAVGLGIDDLLSDRYQYAERENSSIDQSMFKEDQSTYIWENRRKVKCYRMTQKDYAQYLLNNIATSGEYIETSNLDSTFNDILSSQTTNKYSYKATDETLTITIPETRTIIADEDGKAVTVQIGNNTPVKYSLRELSGNGVNGLRYVNGEGFVWVVDTSILDEDLYISYKVEGVADDNQ